MIWSTTDRARVFRFGLSRSVASHSSVKKAIAFFLVKLDWRSMDTDESDDEGEFQRTKKKDVSSVLVTGGEFCGIF